MSGGLSDFNDLLIARGLKEVRRQLLAGLNTEPASADSSAPPDNVYELQVLTIERCLARFMLAMPGGKVWDSEKQQLYRKTAAGDLMGKKLLGEWLAHSDRRTVNEYHVKPVAAAAAAAGGGGLQKALERYVYLYPSSDAWDKDKRIRLPLSSLKHAIADCFDSWIKSESRQEIDMDRLVFDPTQKVNPESHINTFRGLPLSPKFEGCQCDAVYELVVHLCNGNEEIVRWLMCWLAYPLQHVGSKMATAVLMHSDVQGSGKSLFFEEVIKPLYGEYGSTLGQHQLESQYTDWRSQLLFGLFEEIFSRDQKYSHTGLLKHMITGKTQRIEKKFIAGWEEANFMNAVFLSNEIQPFPVETTDRRMLVVWPQNKMPEDLKERVLSELADGGLESFYAVLKSFSLKKFGTHTEPPLTDEKERLIEFGRPSWEVFYREWKQDYLDVPYMPCLSDQLYVVYSRWCGRRNEHKVGQTRFSGFMAARGDITRRRDVHYFKHGQTKAKGVFFIPKEPDEKFRQPADSNQAEWLGKCQRDFAALMNPIGETHEKP